ncbi:Crp/Fnr family transcriptional regulator [Chryseobacterium lathyri]|jgi:CRP-like cAMP-binding protein|uniref:DNA-binding protein n=1 Tax=Chryseobacterium lathyri TaxID=395933 RepID=A0A511YDT3_9FLAO|nr:Crp/Fnr family transcriptional regulator [Chryseobacterium lathyri]GEN73345.1 DNA-binding protein [Chryseobacterium lathyri]
MENIKNHLSNIVDISENDWEIFSSKLSKVNFPKKGILLEKGKIEKYLSFIESGILRFNIPKIEYDFTFAFAFENNFVSGYDSFIKQKPSLYNIETITDCTLWRVSYDDLQNIYATTTIGNRVGRMIAEELYLKKMKRELCLLENSAKQRYLDLFEEQPQLVQNIPLKYLASYIGIRPQSLSRIRKQIY